MNGEDLKKTHFLEGGSNESLSSFTNTFASFEWTVFRSHEPGFEAGSVPAMAAGKADDPVAPVTTIVLSDRVYHRLSSRLTFSNNELG